MATVTAAIWVAWWGCGADDPTDPTQTPTDTVTDTEDPPAVLTATVAVTAPYANAPLVQTLTVTCSSPCSVDASWSDGGTHTASRSMASAASHTVDLLGFRAGSTYTFDIVATDAAGATATASTSLVAAIPPDYFPVAELLVHDPSAVEPGDTLVAARTPLKLPGGGQEVPMVFDDEGFIIWWMYAGSLFLQDALDRPDGRMQTLAGTGFETRVESWNWNGTSAEAWVTDSVVGGPGHFVSTLEGSYFHHDAAVLANGQQLALARFAEPVANYPASYDDKLLTQSGDVTSDVVVHFDVDGTVLDQFEISDLLPYTRIGYDSLEDIKPQGWLDWAHANAIAQDADGHILVSLRHQDAVVKFHATTHELIWILGNHDNWGEEHAAKLLTPSGGDFRWQYHQHGIARRMDLSTVSILMFDNGNYQASPWTGVPTHPDPKSRVVQFTIDEGARTVVQDWAFESPTAGPLYAEAVGDADPQPNGNVLSTWGLLYENASGLHTAQGWGEAGARLIEFDPATGTESWHLFLHSDGAANDEGWTAYRAHRIPSIEGRMVDGTPVAGSP